MSDKQQNPLGRALEAYQKKYNVKQQHLADYLHVDVKTVGRWIRGDTVQTDIRELKRLADKLGIEPEWLGINSSLFVPFELEAVNETVDGVWFLLKEARYAEARAIIERLIQQLEAQISKEDSPLLQGLARAHHVAGHVTSETARTLCLDIPLKHYHEMEKIARTLKDHTMLNLALTYQGDMLRRLGNAYKAISYLQDAVETAPQADVSARGNAIQLLGRAYLQTGNKEAFDSSMSEAIDLTYAIDPAKDVTKGLYCLGTVYEEYARSYATVGQAEKALKYLDLAEKNLPATGLWETLLKTARAMVTIYSGDILNGVKLTVEAADLCYKHGNYRHLERIYRIQAYLDQQSRKFGNAGTTIKDSLQGSIEFTG